jgi:hypothetical protein
LYDIKYDASLATDQYNGFENIPFTLQETRDYMKCYSMLASTDVTVNNTVTIWAIKQPTIDFCIMLKRV